MHTHTCAHTPHTYTSAHTRVHTHTHHSTRSMPSHTCACPHPTHRAMYAHTCACTHHVTGRPHTRPCRQAHCGAGSHAHFSISSGACPALAALQSPGETPSTGGIRPWGRVRRKPALALKPCTWKTVTLDGEHGQGHTQVPVFPCLSLARPFFPGASRLPRG